MKKYLTVICALLTLTAFASCGDNNSTSEESELLESSISETTTEEKTEATTEIKIEQEITTQKQVCDLDSDIMFDVVSLSVPSFCDIKHEENNNKAYLSLYWKDDENHDIRFYFYRDPKRYEKDRFKKNNITDTFTINGNNYMVDPDSYIPTTIFFTNEVASGRIHYDDEDEELVKQIIETIKFNTGKVETTTQKTTEKTNEPVKLDNNYVAIGVGNHSTGISIDYNSEWETKEELNDTETTITYTIKVPYKCKIVCRYVLAPPSLLSAFAYAPNSEWIEKNSEKHPNSSVKTNANGYDFLFYKDKSDRNIFECSNGYTAFSMTISKLYNSSWEDIEDIQQAIFDSIDIIDSYELPEKEVTQPVTEKPTEPQPPVNTENNKALKSAKSYVDMSGFSYEGLILQLEYEGFTHDEAVNAVDSCGADWNAEALESAKSYVKMSGFSYTSLISQLEYEKFTHEQAVYGADNCGADWNQQAADSARSYLNVMSMSREELLDQLLYEGFTQEQAEFGLQSVGY